MKLTIILSAMLFTLFSCRHATSQVKFNGDMEQLTADKSRAAGWKTYFQPEQQKFYPVKVDSLVKQQGKYAVSIEKIGDGGSFGVIDYYIPKKFKGQKIELRGYIKTENVTNGYAGLWLRIDGTTAFDNMQDRGVKGTTDWQEYKIELPYDGDKSINIHAGALLAGSGKVWVDNMKLFIDGQSIEKATEKELTGAAADTAFLGGSKIDTVILNKQRLTNLAALGQVWGFIKYHHPRVIRGDFNMDAQLFRIMPAVLKAKNDIELSKALEQWFDNFGAVSKCTDCSLYKGNDIKLSPSCGMLFAGNVLSKTLKDKLNSILYKSTFTNSYYIAMEPGTGNPHFNNEIGYASMKYPDAGYRLLGLYRYWNMIQYFFPYKYLIGEDWNNVLADCIPKFVGAKNGTDYTLNTLALIARIHDTHANIWNNTTLDDYKGKNAVPVKARFIEDKLVVTGYYNDTLNIKQLVKMGDVIEGINGVAISSLLKQYLPYTPASNYSTQLRDLPSAYLLRGNTEQFKLTIQRDGKVKKVLAPALPVAKVNYRSDFYSNPDKKGFYLLDTNIGYLYPGRYYNNDLPRIKELFKNTKGIIIDMRCYPSEFMPYTFGPYIKTNESAFVKFSNGSISQPGLFTFTPPLAIPPANETYKGRVIVIVNEVSQSQAEYTTMAFQSSPNVIVIGSTTAGADGNVSPIVLPGGIYTMISGIGVYYPDGAETQRKGVKIDLIIKPTIAATKAGRDELLDKAKEIILNDKK